MRNSDPLAALLALILCLPLFVAIYNAMVSPVYQGGRTARYEAYQAGETARTLAEQQARQIEAQEWNATLRTYAVPAAAAVVLVVVAVQAGRTVRHVHSERTRQRALLLLFARQHLPGHNVRVEAVGVRRELVLRDYDKMEQWRPDAVRALLPMMEVDHD